VFIWLIFFSKSHGEKFLCSSSEGLNGLIGENDSGKRNSNDKILEFFVKLQRTFFQIVEKN